MKQRHVYTFFAYLFMVYGLVQCNNTNEQEQKKQQFYSYGLVLYEQRCANCHQTDGNGLANLIPPVKNADYWQNKPSQIPCIMYHGLKGEIHVNGKSYNQVMPPNTDLTPTDLVYLATFLDNAWGRKGALYTRSTVDSLLKNCQPTTNIQPSKDSSLKN